MAYHSSPAAWGQPANASHLDALAADNAPPPPPAHRTPVVGLHSPVHAQRQYQDPNNYSDYSTPGRLNGGPERSQNTTPFSDQNAYEQPMLPRTMPSQQPYGPAAAGLYSSSSSMHSIPVSPPHRIPYSDTPYNRYTSSAQNAAPQMGIINPNDVADDDEWDMGPTPLQPPSSKRRSFAPFGSKAASRGTSRDGSSASPGSSINSGVAGAGVGAAAGAAAGASTKGGNGAYDAVPLANASQDLMGEKSSWKVEDDRRKRKKRMWIVIAIIAVVLLAAVLGGVLGALLKDSGHKSDHNSSGVSAGDVAKDNKDDLGKNSAEIKALMNNQDLHKVFPGMDYTPLNVQYPDCLKAGPSQNNITRDMAVMSQLTNAVRLYGTDCNQTQMLIHAIDRLEIKDTMKIWLGVWLDSNDTTTQRQIAQTWTILDDYGCDYFKGIIIGNEVLYRKDMSATQLLSHISDFRQNITDHKCQLPVAMADLGDNWTADMATKVDYVMSNVHPFFAGVDATVAADWTWNFWQQKDVSLTATNKKIKQVIAEVGWPSAGGTNCGGADTCTKGSVAGITEMNQFMEDWICPSMKNQTEYFWFSAFDEPWKIKYNSKGKNWEDQWGLMDINRNLKPGLKIPSCDGQTLPSF